MIRKIEVNIDEKGKVKSSSDSFLGVCGETNASEICFILCDELVSAIKQTAKEKELFYRFEVTDAQNRRFVLENKSFADEKSFSLCITNAFTEFDGKITVALVIESEDFTLCTVPVDFRVEKDCAGTPNNQEVYSTIVTLFEQAKAQIETELEKSAERCESAQVKADAILSEATAQAEDIKTNTINAANAVLSNINNTCEKATEDINSLLQESNDIFTECEQRKVAAETAAVNAISAANSAAQSKQQAEELLNTKEDVANKETNLMQDVLPDHTKYASAKATQELVNALASSFGSQMYDAHSRLEGIKADKIELEATKQELAEAKAEIERLKTKEDFELVGEIVCDGKTTTYYLRDIAPLKKLFVQLNSPVNFETDLGDFSCYANSFISVDTAIVYTKTYVGTNLFRFYSERIAKGIWKTDVHKFSANSYGNNWESTYIAGNIDYITALRFTCGDGTHFLPEGTKIRVYGVKA